MPIELEITRPAKVRAKELRICCKVRDEFTASLHDESGAEIFTQEDGYVPGFMPGEHYGDHVILDVDLETGQITNWKKPSAKAIQDWISSKDE